MTKCECISLQRLTDVYCFPFANTHTVMHRYTKENLDIYNFSLTADEIAKLNGKHTGVYEA